MPTTTRTIGLAVLLAGITTLSLASSPAAPASSPPSEGAMTHAVPFSLGPALLDPADTSGSLTSLATFYALHDALVKAMPGVGMAPSLAGSWTAARDGLSYDFVLRKHVRFHNGDPLTADDVKFSFERYRGVSAKLLREKVAAVEVVEPHRVRYRLREPWPDFMTYIGTPVSGAAWIVPKAYVERVGDEGFRKAPVGAGPYRFVSMSPGVELVLEAYDGYWRKRPGVKRLTLRSIADESTRLAMLKRGDADVAYNLRGPVAEELQRTPGLSVVRAPLPVVHWVDFASGQWETGSPWHDVRVRRAVAMAIDRQAINQAETLGLSRPAFSIVPAGSPYAWAAPPIPHDPAQAKKLLAEAGHPNGLDAGDYTCDAVFGSLGEAVVNDLGAIGVRARLRPIERAAFVKQWQEKKLKGLVQGQNGMSGGAVVRIQNFMLPGGAFAFGSYPDIEQLFQQQARELDRAKRESLLHAIQRIAYDRVMFAPIFQQAQVNGTGPRLDVLPALVEHVPFLLPYEDLQLKR